MAKRTAAQNIPDTARLDRSVAAQCVDNQASDAQTFDAGIHDGQGLSHDGQLGYEGLVRTSEDGMRNLSLHVEGVHCAACIQKIESAAYKYSCVRKARLNFSTGRVQILWDGAVALANDFVRDIEKQGYRVTPFNPDMDDTLDQKTSRHLLLCLGVCGFALGNIMLLSVGLWVSNEETMGVATRDFMHWVSALIAIPTILFSGRPFFGSAFSALRRGRTNMDVPISIALSLATGMSLYETVQSGEYIYFDSAVMLMFFLLVGRYLDFNTRRTVKQDAGELMQGMNKFATVLDGAKTSRILTRDLKADMIVLVTAGERVPVDGIVIEGQSDADVSLITGETIPVEVRVADYLYTGSVNLSAPIKIRVCKAGEDSLLSDIIRLMEQAQQGQAKYVRIADRAARLYTPVVHVLAICAFILWWGILGSAWQDALIISVSVLIITCPCALGLAVPVVQVLASGILFRRGIMVKSGDALEKLSAIDTVILDKTGTLTTGHAVLKGVYDPEIMRLAASLASHSKHPLSVTLAEARDMDLFEIKDIRDYPGQGIEGVFEGKRIRIGSRVWCGDDNAGGMAHDQNASHQNAPDHNGADHNGPELWFSGEGYKSVQFRFSDPVRGDAAQIVQALKQAGLDVILLSGDRMQAVSDAAAQAGIDKFVGECSPVGKHDYLRRLQSEGRKVLMAGDGLNDAAILSAADISMAPGTAIDLAQNTADIVFMGQNLSPVLNVYKVARKTQKLVRQNFLLAVFYNIIAVPLAFSGVVTPMIAAISMSGSSLVVILNSLRMRVTL